MFKHDSFFSPTTAPLPISIQKFIVLIQSYPALLRKVFEPEDGSITAEFIHDLFVPFFSLKGSNQRALEESLIMTWIQYLQCLEGEEEREAH